MRKFRIKVGERKIGNKYALECKRNFYSFYIATGFEFDNLKDAQKAVVIAKEVEEGLTVTKTYYL
jgi:hypothetical protein